MNNIAQNTTAQNDKENTMTAYIYPAAATHTEKIDDTYTLIEEHWTTGDYTLVRSRYASDKLGTGKSTWTVRAASREIPEITTPSGSTVPEFGVNWAAMGVRNTTEARKYADRIADAARAAERFTMIVETIESE